jgi:hypothetical protein
MCCLQCTETDLDGKELFDAYTSSAQRIPVIQFAQRKEPKQVLDISDK